MGETRGLMEDADTCEVVVKCHKDFLQTMKDYQKSFQKKYGVKPSLFEITKIIDSKIKTIGGLRV